MFTQNFSDYVVPQHDTIECTVGPFLVVARLEYDIDIGYPWDAFEDGRDLVRPASRRTVKRSGEVRLNENWIFDYAGAVKRARAEGWGAPDVYGWHKGGEAAVAAVDKLVSVYRAWLDDKWFFGGVVLDVYTQHDGDRQILETHAASLWGIEVNYPGSDNSYLREAANALLPDALAAAREARRMYALLAEHNDLIDAYAR